jgi:hypothetical protein
MGTREAVKEMAEVVESISPEELAHLKKVNQDVVNSQGIANQAAANLNKALGAQQGHFNYLAAAHKLGEKDTVDFETGQIKRAK